MVAATWMLNFNKFSWVASGISIQTDIVIKVMVFQNVTADIQVSTNISEESAACTYSMALHPLHSWTWQAPLNCWYSSTTLPAMSFQKMVVLKFTVSTTSNLRHCHIHATVEPWCSEFKPSVITHFNTTVLTFCGWFQKKWDVAGEFPSLLCYYTDHSRLSQALY